MSVCCINNSGIHRKVSNCKHELRFVLHNFSFPSPCYFGLARMQQQKTKTKNIIRVDCNDIHAPWKSGSSELYTYLYPLRLSLCYDGTLLTSKPALRSNSRSHPCSASFMSHFIFIMSARSVVRHFLRKRVFVCVDLNRSLQVFP